MALAALAHLSFLASRASVHPAGAILALAALTGVAGCHRSDSDPDQLALGAADHAIAVRQVTIPARSTSMFFARPAE